MKLVLDASMALAWLFERPSPEEAQRAERALLALGQAEARVPQLWHLELANALLVAERRNVISQARIADFLGRLDRLPIEVDNAPPPTRRDATLSVAREHGLTAYDAVYLELALRSGSILATFDQALAASMRRAGGEIFT